MRTELLYCSIDGQVTHRDVLVGVAEHGNEHIQEDNNRDETIRPKHELAHELCEVMFRLQFKVFDVHEAVDGKVQSLQYLEQAASIATTIVSNGFTYEKHQKQGDQR